MRILFKREILRSPLKDNFYRRKSEIEPSFAHSLIYELKVPVDEVDIFGRHWIYRHTVEQLTKENR